MVSRFAARCASTFLLAHLRMLKRRMALLEVLVIRIREIEMDESKRGRLGWLDKGRKEYHLCAMFLPYMLTLRKVCTRFPHYPNPDSMYAHCREYIVIYLPFFAPCAKSDKSLLRYYLGLVLLYYHECIMLFTLLIPSFRILGA